MCKVLLIKIRIDNEVSTMPDCETNYGRALLYGVGLFAHWVISVKVTGTAIILEKKFNIKNPGTHVFNINQKIIIITKWTTSNINK